MGYKSKSNDLIKAYELNTILKEANIDSNIRGEKLTIEQLENSIPNHKWINVSKDINEN